MTPDPSVEATRNIGPEAIKKDVSRIKPLTAA